MKNQVNKEEQALGKRMREHEFSFDPSALAGFESLLAAEDAVAGKAPHLAPPVAAESSPFRKVLTALLLLFVVAGVSLACWHWLDEQVPVVEAESPSTTAVSPAVADHQEPEAIAPSVTSQNTAPVFATAPAPRRPNEATATTTAAPSTTFTPVPQPTTLARRPLPMPRTGEEGQAPPRPRPISDYATDTPARKRPFVVRPLAPPLHQVFYSRTLPEVRLELTKKDDWRP